MNANENCNLLTDTLMNIFRNYIPHKTREFDSKTPEWYYRNPSEYNKETLNQANQCTKLIIEAKQNYIAKMSSKLDCPGTSPKTYWSIINKLLNKKDTKYTASPC